MKIVAGDLVTVGALTAFGVVLWTTRIGTLGGPPKVSGTLEPKDVGIVVGVVDAAAVDAYVLAPGGMGWVATAYLRVISSARINKL